VDDTAPAKVDRYFELLRQVSPAKRLEICLSLSRAVRDLVLAGIVAAHKDGKPTRQEMRYAVAERLYGREVATRVFGAGRQ
jgi:hypothetical protein